ncbi:MAG: hypothetical protein U5K56_04435 [Halioglobus sp.]|nr:hypothetical protein [Halioglobus sp.]
MEDIPGTALAEGIKWQWETFPQYLDTLADGRYAIDIAAQIPHGPLRAYVMGKRGADHTERPTAGEIDRMGELVKQALAGAGASDFRPRAPMVHRASDGQPIPTLDPRRSRSSLGRVAAAMREAGSGLIEIVSDFDPVREEFALIRRIAEVSGRPVSVAVTQEQQPARGALACTAGSDRAGASGRSRHPRTGDGAAGQRIDVPVGRARICSWHRRIIATCWRCRRASVSGKCGGPTPSNAIFWERWISVCLPSPLLCDWEHLDPFDHTVDYLPDESRTIAAQARHLKRGYLSTVAYDASTGPRTAWVRTCAARNYASQDRQVSHDMLRSEHTIVGLGDAGARCGVPRDASMPTFMLTHLDGAPAR